MLRVQLEALIAISNKAQLAVAVLDSGESRIEPSLDISRRSVFSSPTVITFMLIFLAILLSIPLIRFPFTFFEAEIDEQG